MRGSVLAVITLLALAPYARAQDRAATTDSARPTITVPAGTRLETRLERALSKRSVHPGDSVHLQLVHPVVVRDTLVMPAGTYIEARLDALAGHGARLRAELRLHLARLVYPNGYVLATNDPVLGDARDEGVSADPPPALLALDFGTGALGAALGGLRGGWRGAAVGGMIGTGVGTVAILVAVAARRDVALDPGAPVALVLQGPLVLDARRATAPGATAYLVPPPTPSRSCFTPGSPGTPDVVIPGTPATLDVVIPGAPGTPDVVVPGTPGTPPTVIPGIPGTPGHWERCRP